MEHVKKEVITEAQLKDIPPGSKRLACPHASIPVVDTCFLQVSLGVLQADMAE